MQKRERIITETLFKAIVPYLPFESADGAELKIDEDYFGKKRNTNNPSPGSFEIEKNGKQTMKVWSKA